jgi:pyrimidine deaminase RibD-like protein
MPMMDDRACMVRAVEEASHSKSEEQRISPKVGAVAVSNNAEFLGAAHRGEDEHGKDHAEFYLLEKKLQTATLAGATVFTTLEPCFERSEDKVPCAQRLIERQVERVFIGMLDPDPTVHGKGQMHLLEHGIKVATFDPDLTKQILEMNRDFIRERKGSRFEITWPEHGQALAQGKHTVQGTYRRKPADWERFTLLTRREKRYYPHGGFRIISERTWECEIHEYYPGETTIIVAQIDPCSALWVDLYLKVGRDHNKWVGLEIEQLPSGIRPNQQITIRIKE